MHGNSGTTRAGNQPVLIRVPHIGYNKREIV